MLQFRNILKNIVVITVENGQLKILNFIYKWLMALRKQADVLNKLTISL